MTVEQFKTFQRLRAENKMGRIWPEGNGYLVGACEDREKCLLSRHCEATYYDAYSFAVLLSKLAGTPPPPPPHTQTFYSPEALQAWGSRHRLKARRV